HVYLVERVVGRKQSGEGAIGPGDDCARYPIGYRAQNNGSARSTPNPAGSGAGADLLPPSGLARERTVAHLLEPHRLAAQLFEEGAEFVEILCCFGSEIALEDPPLAQDGHHHVVEVLAQVVDAV